MGTHRISANGYNKDYRISVGNVTIKNDGDSGLSTNHFKHGNDAAYLFSGIYTTFVHVL